MTHKEKYIQLLYTYFSLFNKKDLAGLSEIFSDDVTLKDWNISVDGKEQVLSANKTIFEECPDIHVSILDVFQETPFEDSRFACEISIKVSETECISVIDIISFNSENKIKEISAYKQ